jgi:hypothetical protein
MAPDQSEVLLVLWYFWRYNQFFKRGIGKNIDLDMAEVGFVEELNEPIGYISLISAYFPHVCYKDCFEMLAYGPIIRISHNCLH